MKKTNYLLFSIGVLFLFSLFSCKKDKHEKTPIDIQLAGGVDHSMVLRTDQSLWGSGRNNAGQLGNGTTVDAISPVRVADDAIAVSCGHAHTVFIRSDNSAWAMGWNSYWPIG